MEFMKLCFRSKSRSNSLIKAIELFHISTLEAPFHTVIHAAPGSKLITDSATDIAAIM